MWIVHDFLGGTVCCEKNGQNLWAMRLFCLTYSLKDTTFPRDLLKIPSQKCWSAAISVRSLELDVMIISIILRRSFRLYSILVCSGSFQFALIYDKGFKYVFATTDSSFTNPQSEFVCLIL
jgi:hypothetical protein